MNTTITKTTKGHRVWMQGTNDKYGWPVGARYDVTYEEDTIVLDLNPDGKRKVSAGKGGIIDLTSQKVTRWSKGSDSATVLVQAGRQRIIIINQNIG